MKDIAFVAGLGLVGWGCWQYSHALCPVVVGGVVVVLALWAHLRGGDTA